MIDRLLDEFEHVIPQELAIVSPGGSAEYGDIARRTRRFHEQLDGIGVRSGDVVTVEGDFGPNSVAVFLALIWRKCIIVPLSSDSANYHNSFREISQTGWRCVVTTDDCQFLRHSSDGDSHAFYRQLRDRQVAGLVLFTSGSTGAHKAAVHDVSLLLEKFQTRRKRLRTIAFLQLDHIGGVNTLLYTVCNLGLLVTPKKRNPQSVCRAIEDYRVELLPTSPSFLNLLLLSGEIERRDLGSLKLVTYGTEPMPESTLERIADALPSVELQQTYGMTELGILRSKSRDRSSLWVRVGGEGFETKIVDGRLWVRAKSAMLGYLNAPSPFDEEGYLDTGDEVVVDGDWLRILGRKSETINVGGSKVYPTEVETVLLEISEIEDATVTGEENAILGQVTVAHVRLAAPIEPIELKKRIRTYCQGRLPRYAIPQRVVIAERPLHTNRHKRMRIF